MRVQVEVVFWRDGAEVSGPPGAAELQALAERCVAALLASRYPGAAVRIGRRAAGAVSAAGAGREPAC